MPDAVVRAYDNLVRQLPVPLLLFMKKKSTENLTVWTRADGEELQHAAADQLHRACS